MLTSLMLTSLVLTSLMLTSLLVNTTWVVVMKISKHYVKQLKLLDGMVIQEVISYKKYALTTQKLNRKD